MRVLAVDPGKTTGWCLWDKDTGDLKFGEEQQFEFCSRAEALIADKSLDAVVCEAFIITVATAKKTQAPWSLEIIGLLRYLCEKYEVPFILQTPSDAKRFSTNEKLKSIGWYVRGQGHATDSHRHLLLWAVKNGYISAHAVVG